MSDEWDAYRKTTNNFGSLSEKSQTMYCECSAQADDNICTEKFQKAMRFIVPELNWPDINTVCLR
jgi:hypothetical protein